MKLKHNWKEWTKEWKSKLRWAMPGNQCLVCKKKLKRNNINQIISYHPECRHKRHEVAA